MYFNYNHATHDHRLDPPEEVVLPRQGDIAFQWDVDELNCAWFQYTRTGDADWTPTEDEASALMFADMLEEHGDPRAHQVRQLFGQQAWCVSRELVEIPVYAFTLGWYDDNGDFELSRIKCCGVWVRNGAGQVRTIEPLSAKACRLLERIFEHVYEDDKDLRETVEMWVKT